MENVLTICFKDGSNPEELEISGNWRITGECLTTLSTLKVLNVNGCTRLQSKPFMKVLEHNTTLKKLDIRGCTNLDNSVVNCIVSDVTGIEELLLCCYYDFILLNYRT